MVCVLGERDFDAGFRGLFHQDAGEHVDLRVPARVQVLQRREPGRSRAAVPSQDGLYDFDAQRLAHLVDLIEELLPQEGHMFRVKICLKGQVEHSLREVVAYIGGIFGPLVLDDVLHKEDADARARKEFLDRLDALALHRRAFLAQVDAPGDRRVKGDDISAVLAVSALGTDPHERVDDLPGVDHARDLFLGVDPVEKGQDHRIRRDDRPDILQRTLQRSIFHRYEQNVHAPGLFGCFDRGVQCPDLFFVINDDAALLKALFSGAIRHYAEINVFLLCQSIDDIGAHGARAQYGS